MNLADFIGETTEYDKKEKLEERKPKSWLKSVSAFANGIGGVLLFGISDDDVLIGLDDAKDASEKISEAIKTKMILYRKLLWKFTEQEIRNLLF